MPCMSGDTSPIPSDAIVQALADQCVMCGLCLPHCPTYHLSATEAESPRGRIALARALATGSIEPETTLLAHLDHCLGCLSCQEACPSGVRYGEIIDRTRANLRARRAQAGGITRLLESPAWLVRLARLGAALSAHRWLPALARRLPRSSPLRRLAQTVPAPPRMPQFDRVQPLPATSRRVLLFRGCVASVHDRDTFAAAWRLLEALGHEVVASAAGDCCGALPKHVGDAATATRLATDTRRTIERSGAGVVLSTASGCFGTLRDDACTGLDATATDIHAFLAADARWPALRFRALPRRAALHTPCTQANVAGGTAAIRQLLACIPALDLISLPEQPRCCGAAGSHFLRFPHDADRLRDEKLDQAQSLQPDLVLTTNIGCRLHLANGLRERAAATPVLHPLVLLAQQLDNPAP